MPRVGLRKIRRFFWQKANNDRSEPRTLLRRDPCSSSRTARTSSLRSSQPSKEARRSSTSTPISSSTSPTRSTLIDSARSAGKISEWYTLSPAVCLDRMMISARRTSSRVYLAYRRGEARGWRRGDRPGQPWVAQVGVVALVEPGEVSAGFEQSWLGPPDAGTDGWRRRRLARGASPVVPTDRARGPAALHPVEEQLVALEPAGGCQDRHRAPFPAARELGLIAGLLPTQPAVPVPHRESPVASRALLFPGVFVPPHRARPAATSAQDAPGQAVPTTAGALARSRWRHLRGAEVIVRPGAWVSPVALPTRRKTSSRPVGRSRLRRDAGPCRAQRPRAPRRHSRARRR